MTRHEISAIMSSIEGQDIKLVGTERAAGESFHHTFDGKQGHTVQMHGVWPTFVPGREEPGIEHLTEYEYQDALSGQLDRNNLLAKIVARYRASWPEYWKKIPLRPYENQ